MREIYVALAYVIIVGLGVYAPFVFSLAYLWVDTFNPQQVAPAILGSIPASLIVAVLAIGSYLLRDSRKVHLPTVSWLLLLFAAWVTMTTAFWAEVPSEAWVKWDPAFKTICFGAFIPIVFRSRVQIEAALQVYVFSLAVQFVPGGIKTLLGGGGYGLTLGVIGGNSLLAEGSTLCAVTIMIVPILLFLRQHSLLLPLAWLRGGYFVLAVLALATAMGTYERTGLIGMGVMAAGLWWRARRKLLVGLSGLAVAGIIAATTSQAWTARISTIQSYNTEGSALARILVWKWTWTYLQTHPFGGGFNSYIIDTVTLPAQGDQPEIVRHGVAFHSIYFEVLGEQGYVGFALFIGMALLTVYSLQKVIRNTREAPSLLWTSDLARALQVSLLSFMACGAFIGVAFQPMIYFLFAISACVCSHVRRSLILISTPSVPRSEATEMMCYG